jgi:hypothetical protein
MPIASPTGVVSAKSSESVIENQSRRCVFGEGNCAIRIPSDSPSKSWWKTIAVRREAEYAGVSAGRI